jgi:trimeric autotransporter adhesin
MKEVKFIVLCLLIQSIKFYAQTNVLSGLNAGASLTTTGINNVFTGVRAGNTGTIASNNVLVGFAAGRYNITGTDNVFAGYLAGLVNNNICNVFIGSSSGKANKRNNNVYIGFQAGLEDQWGNDNVFTGHKAGWKNVDGDENVFIGSLAGFAMTTGNNNVFVGNSAADNIVSATNNTFVGNNAGSKNTSILNGTVSNPTVNNTFIGANAGLNAGGDSCVFVGNSAGANETESNRLYISNTSATIPLIYGKFDSNQVGINTKNIPSGFAFAVKGKIISEEVTVALQGDVIWPDYVFAKEYKLPNLLEVEKHIKERGHLINIPPAAQVLQNGFSLGDMNIKLLQKIEELTLYMIEQNKKLNEQQKEIENLKKAVSQ